MLRARSWKIVEYLHPNNTETSHAKGQWKIKNRKNNAEMNSHGNKLSTLTNAFHQLFSPPTSTLNLNNSATPIQLLIYQGMRNMAKTKNVARESL